MYKQLNMNQGLTAVFHRRITALRQVALKTLISLLLAACIALAGSHGAWAQDGSGTATLNLKDADITQLINTVAEITGRNFIVDPRVKARVTVVSSVPMRQDEIYDIFLSILQVHGFAAVSGGDGITKIVPDVNAKQTGIAMKQSVSQIANDELVTRVIKLNNVPSNQLVPILRPMIPQQAHMAAYPPSNVLIITDRAGNIERIMDVIASIDRPDNDQIEVVRLDNASASDVVRVITGLLQSNGEAGNIPGSPILTADDRSNSVLLSGNAAARVRIRNIIQQLDSPLQSGDGNTKVIFLKYSDAVDLQPILQGVSTQITNSENAAAQGGGAPLRADIDIQADEANNALIITAPSSILRSLENVVKQLDVPRAQVMVEAIIAEVNTDLLNRLGSQLLVDPGGPGGPVGGSIFSEAVNLGALVDEDTRNTAAAALGASFNGLLAAVGDITGSNRFAFILEALKGDTATNILSTPTIVTLDNVEAEISVGQNVPFRTGSFTTTGATDATGAVNPFQTIERQDVGLTLTITPQINDGDAIKLEISQEVSALAGSVQGAADLVTTQRTIRTEVLVNDGQIIVLGGLQEDRYIDSQQKVPILGSIPIIGRLFSFSNTTKSNQNLMVFLRPVILKDRMTADHFTTAKYAAIRDEQLSSNINKRGLLRFKANLPEIEALMAPLPVNFQPRSSRNEAVDVSNPVNAIPSQNNQGLPFSEPINEAADNLVRPETPVVPTERFDVRPDTQVRPKVSDPIVSTTLPAASVSAASSAAVDTTIALPEIADDNRFDEAFVPQRQAQSQPRRQFVAESDIQDDQFQDDFVEPDPVFETPTTEALTDKAYALQIVGTTDRDKLQRLVDSVFEQGNRADLQILTSERNGQPWYLLIAGFFDSYDQASEAIQRLPSRLKRGQPWIRSTQGLTASR